MMNFETLPDYDKDLKRLLKKYRTLVTDLEVVKKVLKLKPDGNPPFSFPINNLGIKNCVVKVKKIASNSFKGKGVNSGLRLIYAYFEDEQKIVFVELYHKNEKENEDRDRILEYFR
jgi:mRNA-degrading endonuclease RelE of RelBE toxin-antitoxin system